MEKYRVIYGETIPAWEKEFTSFASAVAFAKRHEGYGDVIFSITKITPDNPGPHSVTYALGLDP